MASMPAVVVRIYSSRECEGKNFYQSIKVIKYELNDEDKLESNLNSKRKRVISG